MCPAQCEDGTSVQNLQNCIVMKPTIETTASGTYANNRLLRNGEFVPAAALCARRMSPETLADPNNGLETLYREQVRLGKLRRDALGIEGSVKEVAIEKLGVVNRAITMFERAPEIDLPILDPTFLSWKTVTGFPAFSIFNLDSNRMKIEYVMPILSQTGRDKRLEERMSNDPNMQKGQALVTVTPNLPYEMERFYVNQALRDHLKNICQEKRYRTVTLEARYGGAMPDVVRDRIHSYLDKEEAKERFDSIFIVAEAPGESWKVQGIPQADPLVVGVKHGLLWLIAAYDLTPIEEFAKNLCTTTPDKVRN